jgi:phenylpyruvate tautomerase PptA (4-oxalocrotonate tautomerase family)
MSQYLIVTHKTAFAPELREKVRELAGEDPNAEFAILVPEAPEENYTWEGETVSPAQETAEALMEALETTLGVRVSRIAVGVEDPLQAIAGELRMHQDYDAIVISTLPLGASHWLRLDLVHHAARKFQIPVHHVVGTPVQS